MAKSIGVSEQAKCEFVDIRYFIIIKEKTTKVRSDTLTRVNKNNNILATLLKSYDLTSLKIIYYWNVSPLLKTKLRP